MDKIPHSWNFDFIEAQYQLWKSNPGQLSQDWQYFFEGFEIGLGQEKASLLTTTSGQECLSAKVANLIFYYRNLGHLAAHTNPLEAALYTPHQPPLQIFGLTSEDLEKTVYADFIKKECKLKDLIVWLQETYCGSIGVEYLHIQNDQEREWLGQQMESCHNQPHLDKEQKLRILNKLYQAGIFEQFLHNRYIGQKRFSLEGAEVFIAMLDAAMDRLVDQGCQEIVLGMAHRGRLNVLVNTLWKLYEDIFCEFDDNFDPQTIIGSSDVRYHKGYMATMKTRHGKGILMVLAPNPSHLEAVNPMVEGMVRARQFAMHDRTNSQIVPLLIHGDAAFPGQGIVAETLNLSQLAGYTTGGTLHIILNNQIGFTTLPKDSRSTRYASDLAKMLLIPIFHVNADDPEAAWYTMQLAVDYRMKFHKDVVIDLICYRRYGHNESDEPLFTQPQMYRLIQTRKPVYEIYTQKLLAQKMISKDEVTTIRQGIELCIEEGFQRARATTHIHPMNEFYPSWKDYHGKYEHTPTKTQVPEKTLLELAAQITNIPAGFHAHPKIKKMLERRYQAWKNDDGIDWGNAEAMAYASLLQEGIHIRLTGQDSGRGTFSQRHAVLYDTEDGHRYIPLQTFHNSDGHSHSVLFSIHDSSLSEAAVLGFEYGYSLIDPRYLVIWEAQFGDFANSAQTIIDQFIMSAESKWSRLSGMVLLLPHGFEGQGPEHSSARMERYLLSCAENNIQVCNPTTPAQYFHILRRQIHRHVRKPLVIFTPKSLLRHPLAVSSRDQFANGSFCEVLDDSTSFSQVRKVLLCCGKIYYDLLEQRSQDCAIIRLEQLYPFPTQQLLQIIQRYAGVANWAWVQEEPKNMGAWLFIQQHAAELFPQPLRYIGREASASPASGVFKIHVQEQKKIISEAFA